MLPCKKKFQSIYRKEPFITLGPGDTIRAEMEFYGWNAETLADKLGLSLGETEKLLVNRLPVTLGLAEKLDTLFGQSSQFWMNLEKQCIARNNEK